MEMLEQAVRDTIWVFDDPATSGARFRVDLVGTDDERTWAAEMVAGFTAALGLATDWPPYCRP